MEPLERPSGAGGTVSSGHLYRWKKQYARGKLNNEPTGEGAPLERIGKLEQILGKLTLENEFLKKVLQNTLKEQQKKEGSLPLISPLSKLSKGGAN